MSCSEDTKDVEIIAGGITVIAENNILSNVGNVGSVLKGIMCFVR